MHISACSDVKRTRQLICPPKTIRSKYVVNIYKAGQWATLDCEKKRVINNNSLQSQDKPLDSQSTHILEQPLSPGGAWGSVTETRW